jgi:broad specificity phosphatase PhoE
VIVFTSGGPIGSALQSALAIPDSKVLDIYWAIRNASITTLESRRGRLTASAFNVVSHLEAVNDASLITYR